MPSVTITNVNRSPAPQHSCASKANWALVIPNPESVAKVLA
eukprot:CAMPEP_0204382962 /NCGR_PEP_ID=MMETSP0469-20131031/55558_1 /ASSEMBLY_ACC=CAM_ASM_000384 /TAXON_ID=2969 /ORGANISM="Oxyrrhis marina" /LENGTH=40 /DNA_ID= /DNA_START= /DNA_END= /DNA_ORIENTATION=